MRNIWIVAAIALCAAAPASAQTERAYVTGAGGFTTTPDTTSGDVLAEVGGRIAPRLMVFGDFGKFHNLQPSDAEPAVNSTTALLSAGQGLDVLGTPHTPAWYSVGGLRYELPVHTHLVPYVLGGAGFAHLMPTGQFTYSGGTVPDGSIPAVGADITTQLVTAGDFTAPPATTAFMFTLGGGIDIPVARQWSVDARYRFSRIEADTPLNTQGLTFGFGYRF